MDTTNLRSEIDYVTLEANGDSVTPISVFNRLSGNKKFLMESSLKHEEKGRYSFLGVNPYVEIIGTGNEAAIKLLSSNEISIRKGKILDIVREELPNVELPIPFPYYGGAVGFVSYDLIRQYEDIGHIKADEIDMPDLHFMVYQDAIIFDHVKQTLTLVAINLDGNRNKQALEARLIEMKKEIFAAVAEEKEEVNWKLCFQPSIDKQTFMEMVEKAKESIRKGDIFQIVLSQRLKAQFTVEPFRFYRRLRKSNPSPYMFYLDFQDYVVLGASPENLIKTTGKQITTNPIAGTRPRGRSRAIDQALEKELIKDEKEIAEHNMLVDLSRNDLGKVCEIGSITVPTYMTIERYQYVMHIVSEVKGKLAPRYSSIDALIACLPAGTVSGAPKIRAMQMINEIETEKRGVYGGGVGYINLNGDANIVLAIRTLVIKEQIAYLQAGAGIVLDSDPEAEHTETMNKAKALLEVEGS